MSERLHDQRRKVTNEHFTLASKPMSISSRGVSDAGSRFTPTSMNGSYSDHKSSSAEFHFQRNSSIEFTTSTTKASSTTTTNNNPPSNNLEAVTQPTTGKGSRAKRAAGKVVQAAKMPLKKVANVLNRQRSSHATAIMDGLNKSGSAGSAGSSVGNGGAGGSHRPQELLLGSPEATRRKDKGGSTSVIPEMQRRLSKIASIRNLTGVVSSEKGELVEDGTSEGMDHSEWAVETMERNLRVAVIAMIAFFVGARHPEFSPIVRRMLEYVIVAWLTCCIIALMATWRDPGKDRPAILLLRNTSERLRSGRRGWRRKSSSDDMDEDAAAKNETEELAVVQDDEQPEDEEIQVTSRSIGGGGSTSSSGFQLPHPSLDPYYVIDAYGGNRVVPNAGQPYVLENEWFTGQMMTIIRTPDVDDPKVPVGNADNQFIASYLKTRQRRFEFQFRLKLKKLPEGQRVYFSCDLDEPVKMGIVQRAFVSAAMAFIKSTNSSFHYSMSGSKKEPDGSWEKPHMAFPAEVSMDRIVVTKPGEEPPKLGGQIDEDPESIKRRKKGGIVDWNLEDTYTMALWSAYVDFLEWKVINLPGIRPFELKSVIGDQPILLTLYLIPEDRKAKDKHYRKDITQVVEIEMSNTKKITLGNNAKDWAARNGESRQAGYTRSKSMEKDEEGDDLDDDELDDDELDDDESVAEKRKASADDGHDSDYESAAVAQLGEGMYLRSGDSVVVREVSGEDGDENNEMCYITSGGGFGVLQEGASSTIVIEKARRRRRRRKKAGSDLIRSGDSVIIKLISTTSSGEPGETRYLTIHRGWWLKWVASAPSKNGFFTIWTQETEFSARGRFRSSETQSSYLAFGGSFSLRHKRWSRYAVGVAAEGSATYGGRIMGLFRPDGVTDDNEPNFDDDHHEYPSTELRKETRMKPLLLRADETNSGSAHSTTLSKTGSEEPTVESTNPSESAEIIFSNEDSRLDVPAWVEIMNRTERVRQLAYVVRVETESNKLGTESPTGNENTKSFMRLRTGRDLAQVMRMGLSYRDTKLPDIRRGHKKGTPKARTSSPSATSNLPEHATMTPPKHTMTISPSALGAPSTPLGSSPSKNDMTSSFEDLPEASSRDDETDLALEEDSDDGSIDGEAAPKRNRRKRIVNTIGKIAKTGTATGKKVVNVGVKVGKGTVSLGVNAAVAAGTTAGKVIVGGRSKNPPSREPKARPAKNATLKQMEKDLHAAVNRTVKEIGHEQSSLFFLAGELSPPEQSYRTVSNVLARMSSLPTSSPLSRKFNKILSSQVARASEQDAWFLQGGAVQLGVIPDKSEPLAHDCAVARCLWESHWREEWCGVYISGLKFYAPLSRKPCLELDFIDIKSVRTKETDSRTPLPGFPMLVLETAWLCHYICFANDDARDAFSAKVKDAIATTSRGVPATKAERELWKARFWQGFQNSVESEISALGRGKWAEVAVGGGSKNNHNRTILNCRRAVFDLDPEILQEKGTLEFVEDLLSTALSFSLSSLERDPENLMKFLDATSYLRIIPVLEIDRSTTAAFCLFLNLYHCLLQHSQLLTVNGPLSKHSAVQVMRTSCYEIGGDVFSLSELNTCVIRGRMARPTGVLKPPYVEASKKSEAYRFYALDFTDPRVNFVLNTGDVSCPKSVPVLRPDRLEYQLSLSASIFLERQFFIDLNKRCVVLPKVCEVYKNDWDDEGKKCVQYCSKFVDSTTLSGLKRMLTDDSKLPVSIRYQPIADQYHSKLVLQEEEESSSPLEERVEMGNRPSVRSRENSTA